MQASKRYGIYEVIDEYDDNGRWKGYKVAATASVGKQGKLYPKDDGRHFYKEKPKTEDLEI